MRHLLLTIRFVGTRYHGYQVQGSVPSVARTVQDAVELVFKTRLAIKGCSRTDAGVHANCFALTLRTSSAIPCDALVRAMNVNLPEDIAVTGCREVPEQFHPRYDCLGKRYLYKIHNGPVRDPFLTGFALYHKYPLDTARMHEAAQRFLGAHDFAAFCSSGSTVEDTVRNMTQAAVERAGEQVHFTVTGNGFLYNMVRIMTGTLLEVGRGALAPEDIPRILAEKDRAAAGKTAPAHGLYLDMVFYDNNILKV